MRYSEEQVKAISARLAGHTVPVYETTCGDYKTGVKPIQDEEHLICRGQIIGLEVPRNLKVADKPYQFLKTEFGIFMRVLVTSTAKRHRSKLGNEYIFNIADEDYKALLN